MDGAVDSMIVGWTEQYTASAETSHEDIEQSYGFRCEYSYSGSVTLGEGRLWESIQGLTEAGVTQVNDNNGASTVFAYGVNEIVVTAGTLTNNGQGKVTIATGGGGGGGSGTVTSITNGRFRNRNRYHYFRNFHLHRWN